ncbi:MAG TPA: SGNH/GDSL hydrolase family protein [Acidimicrobiales bacterium]
MKKVKCLVVLFAVAVLAVPAGARADAPAPNYVALGDSYTAGPVIPPYEQPYGCLKSSNNYPHFVAAKLGLPLRDESCSGAETGDMFAPQGVTPGPNPAQLDALDAGTQIVTLGIGGNDIGFSSIAEDCASVEPTGTPCQDKFVVNGDDQVSDRIAQTGPKVANVLQAIHQRSPDARVFVVDYLPILPETGMGCWPTLPIAWGDVPYLRAKEKELNAMLATQAAGNDATFVDAYDATIGHDSCQPPGLRWVEQVVPTSPAAPVHPNLLGEKAYAAVVLGAINGQPTGRLGLLPPL